jgi:hypothetical protein
MPDLVIRPAVGDDLDVLWDFLAIAAYEPDAQAAKAVPGVAKYLVGWQATGGFRVHRRTERSMGCFGSTIQERLAVTG